jgi:G3E family GTPase
LNISVLASIDEVLRDSATFALLADHPGTVAVRHDLSWAESRGMLRRVVSDSTGVIEDVVLPLEHECLGCSLREDALTTLERLAELGSWRHAVLSLPVGSEPASVVRVLSDASRTADRLALAGVVALVAQPTLVEDLFGDDLLAERGLATGVSDRRAVGEVLAHQIEVADLLLVDGDDPIHAATRRLLGQLATTDTEIRRGPLDVPAAAVLASRHRPDPEGRRGAHRHATPSGVPDGDGVWTLDLHTWRPLHPMRLLERIEELGGGRTRGRGRFWLPTRPARAVAWDGAGAQLSIGDAGPWGDDERSTRIVVTGIDRADRQRVLSAFADVELRDDELARGREWWLSRDDVYDQWLGSRPTVP